MRRKSSVSLRSQSGSALVVAIFIITVMSMMAATMIKINASQVVTTTQEVLGTRAWFVAHSGIEISLNALFPIGNPLQMLACENVPTQISLVDFDSCKVTIECDEYGAETTRRIQLRSIGRCGSGQYQVVRQQQVWVKGLVR